MKKNQLCHRRISIELLLKYKDDLSIYKEVFKIPEHVPGWLTSIWKSNDNRREL